MIFIAAKDLGQLSKLKVIIKKNYWLSVKSIEVTTVLQETILPPIMMSNMAG